MSVHHLVFISCDACEEIMEHGSHPGFTAEEARATVKRLCGAHRRPGGRDICGTCWDQGYR